MFNHRDMFLLATTMPASTSHTLQTQRYWNWKGKQLQFVYILYNIGLLFVRNLWQPGFLWLWRLHFRKGRYKTFFKIYRKSRKILKQHLTDCTQTPCFIEGLRWLYNLLLLLFVTLYIQLMSNSVVLESRWATTRTWTTVKTAWWVEIKQRKW